MKKYIRFFHVVLPDVAKVAKLESDMPFSESEGRAQLKESYPAARKIVYVPKEKALDITILSSYYESD